MRSVDPLHHLVPAQVEIQHSLHDCLHSGASRTQGVRGKTSRFNDFITIKYQEVAELFN